MFFASHSSWSNILRRIPLCLLALALLAHCGVSETTAPGTAKYFPLPEKYAIKDEYFVAVNARPELGYDKERMDDLYDYLTQLMRLPSADDPEFTVDIQLQGCDGKTDRDDFEDKWSNLFCVRLPHSDRMVHSLLHHDLVRYVEAHGRVVSTGVQVCPPSWGLDYIDEPGSPLSRGNGVYAYSRTGKGVHVYLFDGGIDNSAEIVRPDPAGLEICEANPMSPACHPRDDGNGHGTFLAEIIGGKRGGVAKEAIIHSMRVFHETGKPCNHESETKTAIDYVNSAMTKLLDKECYDAMKMKSKPTIENIVAVLPFTEDYDMGMGTTLGDKVKKLIDCDIVVIASAGNKSQRIEKDEKLAPAGVPGVITVASFNEKMDFSDFSNFGPAVTLAAPGDNIEVISPHLLKNRCPPQLKGTSAAAAYTAGVAAQIMEHRYSTPRTAPVSMADKIASELTAVARSGLYGLVSRPGTPDLALRSPYGTGTTGGSDPMTDHDADGKNDAVSFDDCAADSSCAEEGFCKSRKVNRCDGGIDRPLGREQCGRGVYCENGYCQSCGLNKEVCCADGIPGSFKCATEDLKCNSNTGRCEGCGKLGQACCIDPVGMLRKCGNEHLNCVITKTTMGEKDRCESCGGTGEPCCENPDEAKKCPGNNLICGTSGLCEVCGKRDLQCCANSQCDSSLACEMNKCVCGKVNQPCCGFDCYPGTQCDSASRTCKACGGPGQDCCLSPAPACQGDMMCNGGKCKGECYARCKNGLLLYGANHIDHGSCLAFGEAKCSECSSVKSNQLLRATYNYYYLKRENHCPPSKGQECEACRSDCPTGSSCKPEDRPMGTEIKCSAPYCIDGGSPDWCIHSRDSCQ